jgi:hypothetical protein
MDPFNMQQFIAEQEAMVDPDRAAAEALTAEKHYKHLMYNRMQYDRSGKECWKKEKSNLFRTVVMLAGQGFQEHRSFVLHND